MQPAPKGPAEEPPSILWGLDPMFSACARLYVRDILEMTESIQVPGKFNNNKTEVMLTSFTYSFVCIHPCLQGIYFYNLHPVYKIDVLGTVVYKREREDFFCYGGNLAVCGSKI